jgi:hypothetical protein
MATSYTSDKKIGALDPITGTLDPNDEFVVNKNGDTLKTSVAQVEEAMFNTKTPGGTPQVNDTVVIRRGSLIRQLETQNLIPDGAITKEKIVAAAGIEDGKLAKITTAGKVGGGAITDGTVGGSTAINTSGNITTTGTLAAGNTTITGTLAAGNTTITGTAAVSSNATIGGALGVTGAITASGGVVGNVDTATKLSSNRTFALTGDVAGSVSSDLTSGASIASTIANSAVTAAKIADANVTAAKIADANVTTAKIADSNVTTAKIADSNVTAAKIADSNVTTVKIADGNVTTVKIADGNVTTAKIADSSVTTAKIADSSVTTAKIADGNVTASKIADGNVTTSKIPDSNVTTAKIADGAITASKLNSAVRFPMSIRWSAAFLPSVVKLGSYPSDVEVNRAGTGHFRITHSSITNASQWTAIPVAQRASQESAIRIAYPLYNTGSAFIDIYVSTSSGALTDSGYNTVTVILQQSA